jgi:hypothetical protein
MKLFARKHQSDEPGPGTRGMISAFRRLGYLLKPEDPWAASTGWLFDEMARRIVELEQKMEAAKAAPSGE